MVLNFKPISLEQQSEYSKYFAKCPQKTSDYSFVNLWGWAKEYGLEWAWTDNLVWIRQTIPKILYWAPIGSWDGIDWKSCFEELSGRQALFIRIPEELLRVWEESYGDRIAIEEERSNWDYIYLISELIELTGKRFHKKRTCLISSKKITTFSLFLLVQKRSIWP